MLTIQQINTLQHQLQRLLPELKVTTGKCIEYAAVDDETGYFTYLRICFMMTAGGMQYACKLVHRGGSEGSGYYTPNDTDMVEYAMDRILHYHRPMPNLMFAKEKGREFNFQLKEKPVTGLLPHQKSTLDRWDDLMKDAVTVTLDLPKGVGK